MAPPTNKRAAVCGTDVSPLLRLCVRAVNKAAEVEMLPADASRSRPRACRAWPQTRGELVELRLKSGRHGAEGSVRTNERSLSGRVEEVMLASTAPALRRGRTDVGTHHSLALEALERHVHGARRELAARTREDFPMNRGAKRAVAEAQQRQEHEQFELSENRAYSGRPHIELTGAPPHTSRLRSSSFGEARRSLGEGGGSVACGGPAPRAAPSQARRARLIVTLYVIWARRQIFWLAVYVPRRYDSAASSSAAPRSGWRVTESMQRRWGGTFA
jgi:hypothetical protein